MNSKCEAATLKATRHLNKFNNLTSGINAEQIPVTILSQGYIYLRIGSQDLFTPKEKLSSYSLWNKQKGIQGTSLLWNETIKTEKRFVVDEARNYRFRPKKQIRNITCMRRCVKCKICLIEIFFSSMIDLVWGPNALNRALPALIILPGYTVQGREVAYLLFNNVCCNWSVFRIGYFRSYQISVSISCHLLIISSYHKKKYFPKIIKTYNSDLLNEGSAGIGKQVWYRDVIVTVNHVTFSLQNSNKLSPDCRRKCFIWTFF